VRGADKKKSMQQPITVGNGNCRIPDRASAIPLCHVKAHVRLDAPGGILRRTLAAQRLGVFFLEDAHDVFVTAAESPPHGFHGRSCAQR